MGSPNRVARALSAHPRFVVVGRRARYYPHGEDAILMTLETQPQKVRSPPVSADVEVLENVAEGGENYRLALRVPGWPGAEPGQFLMLSPGVRTEVEQTDPLLPRPMAIFQQEPAGPSASRVEVLYKATGRGTRLLAEARPGEYLRILGPLGAAFPIQAAGERAILVGGGTGTASLYELAARCAEKGAVDVILGARSETDLMAVSLFEKLDVTLHLTTEDGGRGHPGRVTDLLPRLLGNPLEAISLYACGPTPMMRACVELAAEAGLTRCWVSLENTMACGFGVCLGCAVPLRAGGFSLLCRAGPVYQAAEIQWEGLR
ncbi:MAG: dihydroorotate dehydrogenase electron transfer subunit [Myxococcota bacterium]